MARFRAHTFVAALVFGSICVAGTTASAEESYKRMAAEDELVAAFQACEEALRDETPAARKLEAAADYKSRRTNAVHMAPKILKAKAVQAYQVKKWLSRCDVKLRSVVAREKKAAALLEAEAALDQCRTENATLSLDDAESSYQTFKQHKQAALKLDPGTPAARQLKACDKRATASLAKRREQAAADAAPLTAAAEKAVEAARREQETSLGGSETGARLAVAIPAR